ncbi:hypothetical protein WDU94_012225, partial [Cyamophila willieti]
KWSQKQDEIRVLHDKINKLELELKDVDSNCKSLEQKKVQAEDRINKLLTENDEETTELDFMIKARDKEIIRLKAHVVNIEKINTEMKSTLLSLETDNNGLKQKIDIDRIRIENLIEENDKQILELENKLMVNNNEMKKLRCEIHKIENMKTDYEIKIHSMEMENKNLSDKISGLKSKISDLTITNDSLRGMEASYEGEISTYKKTSEENSKEMETMKEENRELLRINSELKEMMSDMKTTISFLEKTISSRQEVINGEQYKDEQIVDDSINVHLEFSNTIYELRDSLQKEVEEVEKENYSVMNLGTGDEAAKDETLNLAYDSGEAEDVEVMEVAGEEFTKVMDTRRTDRNKEQPLSSPGKGPYVSKQPSESDLEVAWRLKLEELEGEIISNRERISRLEKSQDPNGFEVQMEKQNSISTEPNITHGRNNVTHRRGGPDQIGGKSSLGWNRADVHRTRNHSIVERRHGTPKRVNRNERDKTTSYRSSEPSTSQWSEPAATVPFKSKNKTVFILGDSQGRQLSKYIEELQNSGEDWVYRSFISPGAAFLNCIERGLEVWKDEIKSSIQCHFVIVAGTIDCAGSVNWKLVDTGIEKIKGLLKHGSITIILTPFRLDCGHLNDNVYKFNRRLKQKLGEIRNIGIIDPHEVIPTFNYYKRDGYHLNNRAKQVLGKCVIRAITESYKTKKTNFQ